MPVNWSPRSRQKVGERTEREVVKKMGGRVHPRSGAGRIKWDGSTEKELIEVKDANESHQLKGSYLASLYKDAARQGKEAVYVVRFEKAGVTVECRVRRDRPSKDG